MFGHDVFENGAPCLRPCEVNHSELASSYIYLSFVIGIPIMAILEFGTKKAIEIFWCCFLGLGNLILIICSIGIAYTKSESNSPFCNITLSEYEYLSAYSFRIRIPVGIDSFRIRIPVGIDHHCISVACFFVFYLFDTYCKFFKER